MRNVGMALRRRTEREVDTKSGEGMEVDSAKGTN
jgi:hypothetical protein